jgi:hypothetical protein
MTPDLDRWIADPALRVAHRRVSSASADDLWEAAVRVRISDVGLLGRLIRWRIPGTPPGIPFDTLFRNPPFMVLLEGDLVLVSGLVGRIWTLRRDYPRLADPGEFRHWSAPGTARVMLANWIEPVAGGGAALASETRVAAVGAQGRLGVAAVRPLVSTFQHLIASDGMSAVVRMAEKGD